MKRARVIIIVGLAIPMASLFYLLFAASSSHKPAESVELMIPKGASTISIGRMLEERDVISSKVVFRLVSSLKGVSLKLKSGLYRFEEATSMNAIIKRLVQGDVMQFRITVPEGLRNDEVLALLSEKSGVEIGMWEAELARLLPSGAEGQLLPETYHYTRPLAPDVLLSSMIEAQQKVLNTLSSDPAEQQRIRTIASIIEKETMLEHERPLVSAVIHNRLKLAMPLQMDPTVIYGIWKTKGAFSGNIRKVDLSSDTPWNSYTRKGLPPTPIGGPGVASLQAAAAPADVDHLYFVADGTGGHKFSATHEQHLKHVRQWVRIERERSGK